MESYFGFKIAAKYNEKNLRAAYRFCKNDVLLHDLSYYSILSLTGKSLDKLLKIYLKIDFLNLPEEFF